MGSADRFLAEAVRAEVGQQWIDLARDNLVGDQLRKERAHRDRRMRDDLAIAWDGRQQPCAGAAVGRDRARRYRPAREARVLRLRDVVLEAGDQLACPVPGLLA